MSQPVTYGDLTELVSGMLWGTNPEDPASNGQKKAGLAAAADA